MRFLQFGLPGHVVAKANAIIEYPEHHVELAVIHVFFDKACAQLVVVIPHETALTPRLLPGVVLAACRLFFQLQITHQLAAIAKDETQPRIIDHRLAIAQHAIGQAPFTIEIQLHLDTPIGGLHLRHVFGMDKPWESQRQQQCI